MCKRERECAHAYKWQHMGTMMSMDDCSVPAHMRHCGGVCTHGRDSVIM